jgi:6-phosphogluconolactonase
MATHPEAEAIPPFVSSAADSYGRIIAVDHGEHRIERFYLGSYTELGGLGIASGAIDATTGRPSIDSWTAAVDQPSWVDVTLDGKTLYAVSELTPDGRAHSLRIEEDGELKPLNSQSTGAKPAHLAIHPRGEFLFTSLYDGGGVAVHPLAPDGSIEPVSDVLRHSAPGRQAHAHQIVLDPSGQYILAVDLGLDIVFSYELDARAGQLIESDRAEFRTGSGPRHLVFHPNADYLYLVNELDSTVTVCRWAAGTLIVGQVCSTMLTSDAENRSAEAKTHPPEVENTPTVIENYPAEIVASADGRFLYVSNRGSNTIAVLAIEDGGATVRLLATPACGGDWPRHLALDATGKWLYSANERSGDLAWFPIDAGSGLLGSIAGRLPAKGVTQLRFV